MTTWYIFDEEGVANPFPTQRHYIDQGHRLPRDIRQNEIEKLFTVIDRHLELIMLYVRWAAFQELATTESSNPDPTSLALSTLELNAYRAQRLYYQSMNDAEKAESRSATAQWTMDKWDRTY